MPAWLPYAIVTGLGIVSDLFASGQYKDLGEVPEPDWERMSELHQEMLHKVLAPLRDPSQLRLEAQRMGVAESGAYLQGITQMQQKYMEVMARETGIFELQQTMQQTEWEQRKFLLEREWALQSQQRKAGTIESILGRMAGGYMGYEAGKGQEKWMEQLMQIIGGGGQGGGGLQKGGEMIDILWDSDRDTWWTKQLGGMEIPGGMGA